MDPNPATQRIRQTFVDDTFTKQWSIVFFCLALLSADVAVRAVLTSKYPLTRH